MKPKGTVYLVGAGPGDTGLLTLRGAELLGGADVVVYDALVNPELLQLAPSSAEVIFGGKRAKDHAISQDELNQLLIAKAREGKSDQFSPESLSFDREDLMVPRSRCTTESEPHLMAACIARLSPNSPPLGIADW